MFLVRSFRFRFATVYCFDVWLSVLLSITELPVVRGRSNVIVYPYHVCRPIGCILLFRQSWADGL